MSLFAVACSSQPPSDSVGGGSAASVEKVDRRVALNAGEAAASSTRFYDRDDNQLLARQTQVYFPDSTDSVTVYESLQTAERVILVRNGATLYANDGVDWLETSGENIDRLIASAISGLDVLEPRWTELPVAQYTGPYLDVDEGLSASIGTSGGQQAIDELNRLDPSLQLQDLSAEDATWVQWRSDNELVGEEFHLALDHGNAELPTNISIERTFWAMNSDEVQSFVEKEIDARGVVTEGLEVTLSVALGQPLNAQITLAAFQAGAGAATIAGVAVGSRALGATMGLGTALSPAIAGLLFAAALIALLIWISNLECPDGSSGFACLGQMIAGTATAAAAIIGGLSVNASTGGGGNRDGRQREKENREWKRAVRECERALQRTFNKADLDKLHQWITGQGFTFEELLEECIGGAWL